MMKKIDIIKAALCGIIITLFMGCEVGLGPAIDLKPPRMALTNPGDNDTKPYTFTLAGKVTDNESIDKIDIDFGEAGIYYRWEGGNSWKKKTAATEGRWVLMDLNRARFDKKKKNLLQYRIFVDLNEAEESYLADNRTFNITAQAFDSMNNSGKNSKVERSFTIDTEDPNVSISTPVLLLGTMGEARGIAEDYKLRDSAILSKLHNGDFTIRGHQEGSVIFRELRIEFDNDATYGTRNDFDEDTRSTTEQGNFDDSSSSLRCKDIASHSDFSYKRTDRDGRPTTTYAVKTLRLKDDNGDPAKDDEGNIITDLRNWWINVKADDIIYGTDENGKQNDTIEHPEMKKGSHLIRVVSTSISSSGAWERRVLGFFVWWPESDIPWVSINSVNETDLPKGDKDKKGIYPGSSVTGVANDDDGIQRLDYVIEKKNTAGEYEPYQTREDILVEMGDDGKPKDNQDIKTYYQYSLRGPSEEGEYRVRVLVTDINGLTNETKGADEEFSNYDKGGTGYFKTLDVKAPVLKFGMYNSSGKAIYEEVTNENGVTTTNTGSITDVESDGVIEVRGTVSDDGDVDSVKMVYINPNLKPEDCGKVLTQYISGGDKGWSGVKDDGKRILFDDITLTPKAATSDSSDSESEGKTYEFSKQITLSELGIDGVTKKLVTQQFMLVAKDTGNTTSTPEIVSLTGDRVLPDVTLKDIKVGSVTKNFKNGDDGIVPTFETFTSATISGKWKDNTTNITSLWQDASKMFTVTFGGKKLESITTTATLGDKDDKGYYDYSIVLEGLSTDAMGSINVTFSDFGGNKASVTKNYQTTGGDLSWNAIGTTDNTDDGIYKAGVTLEITTNFASKNQIRFSGGTTPRLKLNITNGGVNQYAVYSSGNGSDTHVYTYTIKAGDEVKDGGKVDAIALEENGNTWRDTTLNKVLPMNYPKAHLDSRDIRVDTVAPTIKSIKSLSDVGSYNSQKSVLISVDFGENITVSDTTKLSLTLGDSIGTVSECYSTDKGVVFIYGVKAGDNASPLKVTGFSKGTAVIKDTAGNEFTSASAASVTKSLEGVIVDTTAPAVPVLSFTNGSDIAYTLTARSLNIFESGAGFTVTNAESGATVYYKMQSSAADSKYTKKVGLPNNGLYLISAYQVDAAGNKSAACDDYNIKVDIGKVLKKITSSNSNGIYATGSAITIQLLFTKAVTISRGATLTLNAASGKTAKTATLSTTTTNETQEFTYTVGNDDVIASDDTLNVTALSFNTVSASGMNIPVALSDLTGGNLSDNKDIKIKSGTPQITGATITCDEGSDTAKLTVTFDRGVQKNTGNITITQTDTYRAPLVMTESEYQKLLGVAPSASSLYTKGTNGAIKSGSTLDYDTSTKYILNYSLDTSSTQYTSLSSTLSTEEGYGKVTIPMYASAVELPQGATTLTVNLTDSYKLPTLGATYSINISAGIVGDSQVSGSLSAAKSYPNITAGGVEAPVIRVDKGSGRSETISGGVATQKLQTNVKMDCRTVGATIKYGKNEKESTQSTFAGGPHTGVEAANSYAISKTAGADIPSTIATTYIGVIQLGDTNTASASARAARAGSTIILHAKGWNRVYYWGGDCTPAVSFPGTNMTAEGNDWYTITISGTTTSLLFNYQNNQGWKTADLTRTSGEWWFVGNTSVSGQSGTWYTSNPDGSGPTPPTPTPTPSAGSGVKGLKIALAARATKGSSTSIISYEYACRSVLYLEITGGDKQGYQNNIDNLRFAGDSTNTARSSLSMWVCGGDGDSGENGVVGFPLSWSPSKWNTANNGGIHLMTGGFTNDPLNGTWYYCTWEVTTPACIGFLLGDVPSDAATNGPSKWVWGNNAWCAYKSMYKLYPGEKLWMKSCYASRFTGMDAYNGKVESNVSHGSLEFEKDNTGKR